VDARLTDSQRLLVDVVAALANDIAPTTRDLPRDGPSPSAMDGWEAVVAAGLVGLRLPTSLGGPGATAVEVALVTEQLGRRLVVAPYLGQGVLAPALAERAPADVVARVLDGSARWTVALSPDLQGLARLGGPAIAVDATGAEAAIVLDDAGRPRLVDLHAATRLDAIDLTRTTLAVAADAPVLDLDLGGVLDAPTRVRLTALALVVAAADALGVMASAHDAAVAHVKERHQFGVAVGSFQAVQHLAADAFVQVEASRSCVWYAAWAVDALDPDEALLAARQAKAFVSEAAREVTETAIQLLGGIGMTWEELAHVRLRRALFDRALFGDETVQLVAITRARLAPLGAGAG
jgi:alkylation response protein AidB-like acyl-CoA dehydrogenase